MENEKSAQSKASPRDCLAKRNDPQSFERQLNLVYYWKTVLRDGLGKVKKASESGTFRTEWIRMKRKSKKKTKRRIYDQETTLFKVKWR